VFKGLNRLLAAALIAVAVFVVPSTALAGGGCGGAPSAQQVYKECVPNGSGGSNGGKSGGGTPKTSGQGSGYTAPAISSQTAKVLKKAGKEGKSLQKLVRAYGMRRVLESSHGTASAEPTAIDSAFDLGSGPTVLLIGLAGTMILLLVAGGYRGVRHRRH
jgi:hypothetical protein